MTGWRWFWRVIGLAIAASAIGAVGLLWAHLRATPIVPTGGGQTMAEGLDVIAVQIDVLSVTMAALGIGLGVMALFGYHSIKDAAETAAIKSAGGKADEVATKAVAEHIEKLDQKYAMLDRQPAPPSVDPGAVTELRKGD